MKCRRERKMDNDKYRKDISNRLKRIEGQVKGIQGMVEKENSAFYCFAQL